MSKRGIRFTIATPRDGGPFLVKVSGTDTGIGKTLFAAALADTIQASYWKPVQSGLQDEPDSDVVARLVSPAGCILPEVYRVSTNADLSGYREKV